MGTWTVARRELASLASSPVALIAAVAYLVVTGVWLFFLNHFFAQNEASLRLYFNVLPVVFAILLPALTMRWARERRSGTLEILMTPPLRDGEIVFGKFLGALVLLAGLLVFSLPLPLSLAPLGAFDPGQVTCQYLGALLIGAAGIAAGLFMSSLCRGQAAAFILGALLLTALTLAGPAVVMIALPPWLAAALSYASFSSHFDSFKKGLLDSRDILYFFAAIGLFLFLSSRALARRRES